MIVAGDSKVSSVANVSAELKVVIAYNLRPVIDKLELIFGFPEADSCIGSHRDHTRNC